MSKINLGEPYNRDMKTYTCHHCYNQFVPNTKPKYEDKAFCSRSCACTHRNIETANNHKQAGTKRTWNKTYTNNCKTCNTPIKSIFTYCTECQPEKTDYNSYTLAQLKQEYSIHQYNAKIRGYSKPMVKGRVKSCVNCGYDKHVEVCHIKAIKDFDLCATVGEVNDPSNLILLCPNCHWEFDNGLLKLEDINC